MEEKKLTKTQKKNLKRRQSKKGKTEEDKTE
jgi:hypothetical protein